MLRHVFIAWLCIHLSQQQQCPDPSRERAACEDSNYIQFQFLQLFPARECCQQQFSVFHIMIVVSLVLSRAHNLHWIIQLFMLLFLPPKFWLNYGACATSSHSPEKCCASQQPTAGTERKSGKSKSKIHATAALSAKFDVRREEWKFKTSHTPGKVQTFLGWLARLVNLPPSSSFELNDFKAALKGGNLAPHHQGKKASCRRRVMKRDYQR